MFGICYICGCAEPLSAQAESLEKVPVTKDVDLLCTVCLSEIDRKILSVLVSFW
jgi:hypothetical protein